MYYMLYKVCMYILSMYGYTHYTQLLLCLHNLHNYHSLACQFLMCILCSQTVPPTVRFLGVLGPVLGIVHGMVTMSFAIDNASPDVLPGDTVWRFNRGGTITTIREDEDSRYMFSSDRRSLTIANLTHENEGQYELFARNAAGSHSFVINLAIEGKKYWTGTYSTGTASEYTEFRYIQPLIQPGPLLGITCDIHGTATIANRHLLVFTN